MIGETETALLDTVKSLFGQTLRDIDTHPGTWDDVAIKRMILSEPAVYLAWLGCGEGRTAREVESRWVFYVCASMLNGREGDRLEVYQIVERLVAGINWKSFGPTSALKLTKAQNLYTDAQGAAGCALYGLYFSGRTPIAGDVDLSSLDDYERHWQTWKHPDGTPPFEAHINVNEKKTMSDTLKLKPVAGRTVRDPKTMKVLAADGEEKPRTSYWTRRLADGDVALVEATTSGDARTATDAGNSDKSAADESPTPAKKGAK